MTKNDSRAELALWVGLEEQRADTVDHFRVQALGAVLDSSPRSALDAQLRPAWH